MAVPAVGYGCNVQCTKPYWVHKEKLSVPCGKCLPCRIQRAREWSVRLVHETQYHEKSAFITLTYNEENMPSDGSLSIRELQLFMKRLRKDLEPRRIKYYACGEYGDQFNRPHYHAIIFGLGSEEKDLVEKAWCKGFVYLGTVTYDSCRYVADYVMKKYDGKKQKEVYGDKQVPFSKTSQGLGKNFAMDQAEHITRRMGITLRGTEVGIPRYYKKILEIDPSLLAEKAREKFIERLAIYEKRSGVYESALERVKSIEQNERNLQARTTIKKKGIL